MGLAFQRRWRALVSRLGGVLDRASGHDRVVRLAIVVALVVRACWTLAAAGRPAGPLDDAAQYVRIARQLASGHEPTIGGRPSAFHSVGYPLFLVPMVWLDRLTFGLIGMPILAGLANAVAGSGAVAITGSLARRVAGARAAHVAAWALALWPAGIVISAAAVGDTLVVLLVLGSVAVALHVYDQLGPGDRASWRMFVWLGALVALAVLVRANSIVLVVLPALMAGRPVRRRAQETAMLLLVVAAFVSPVVVRNALRVGIPNTSTGAADSICLSNRDGADGLPDFSTSALIDCYTGSPFDDPRFYPPNSHRQRLLTGTPPDEARWYRRTNAASARWIRTHPRRFAELLGTKSVEITSTTRASIGFAGDSGMRVKLNPDLRERLQLVSDAWLVVVWGLALVGLTNVRATRRAWLWVIPLLLFASALPGVAIDRYNLPVMPFMVVAAASSLAAAWPPPERAPRWARRPGRGSPVASSG